MECALKNEYPSAILQSLICNLAISNLQSRPPSEPRRKGASALALQRHGSLPFFSFFPSRPSVSSKIGLSYRRSKGRRNSQRWILNGGQGTSQRWNLNLNYCGFKTLRTPGHKWRSGAPGTAVGSRAARAHGAWIAIVPIANAMLIVIALNYCGCSTVLSPWGRSNSHERGEWQSEWGQGGRQMANGKWQASSREARRPRGGVPHNIPRTPHALGWHFPALLTMATPKSSHLHLSFAISYSPPAMCRLSPPALSLADW